MSNKPIKNGWRDGIVKKKNKEEEIDETFEIISEKEKMWRNFLIEAESNYLKSEASMLQNKVMINLAYEEIKKESDKNK